MHDRGPRAHPAALRERRARLARRLAGRARPQELASVRGRRLGGRAGVGLGAPRGALARPARRAERASCCGTPRMMHPVAAARTHLPVGARRGLRRHVPRAVRAVYADVARGGPSADPDYPTFRDGHVENVLCDAVALSNRERRWVEVTRMKLGLLTAPFPRRSLEQVAAWAAGEGFEMLEVACWPAAGGERRRYAGTSHIDVSRLDAGAVRDVLDRHGLEISSLAYYPNNLHPDPAERRAANTHLQEGDRRRGEARRRRSSAPSSGATRRRTSPTTSASSERSGRGSSTTPSRAA